MRLTATFSFERLIDSASGIFTGRPRRMYLKARSTIRL
jgi:hypothetical protein